MFDPRNPALSRRCTPSLSTPGSATSSGRGSNEHRRDVRSMGESRRVPLRSLRLDPENPRFSADMHGEPQEELAVHLELGFDALTVAESIASHGYFGSEPLIVISGPTEHGEPTWIVSRATGDSQPSSASSIPASASSSPTPPHGRHWRSEGCGVRRRPRPRGRAARPRSATPIIGFRHISGILQWQPYAQARYIARLVDEEGMDFGEVAKMIGIDRTKVGNLYRDQAIAKQAASAGDRDRAAGGRLLPDDGGDVDAQNSATTSAHRSARRPNTTKSPFRPAGPASCGN